MAYQSILSNPVYSPKVGPAPDAPVTGYRSIIPRQTPAQAQAAALSRASETSQLSAQLPKLNTPKTNPATINDLPSLQAALKSGAINHDQFLTRFAQVQHAPTKATTANKIGNVLGGLKQGVVDTGKGIGEATINTGKAPLNALSLGVSNVIGAPGQAASSRAALTKSATNSFISPLAQLAVLAGANVAAGHIMADKNTSPAEKTAQLNQAVNPVLNKVGFDLGDAGNRQKLKEAGLVALAASIPLLSKGGIEALGQRGALTANAQTTLRNVASRKVAQVGEAANKAVADSNKPIPFPKAPPKPGALVKSPKLLAGPSGTESAGPAGFIRTGSGPTLTPKNNVNLLRDAQNAPRPPAAPKGVKMGKTKTPVAPKVESTPVKTAEAKVVKATTEAKKPGGSPSGGSSAPLLSKTSEARTVAAAKEVKTPKVPETTDQPQPVSKSLRSSLAKVKNTKQGVAVISQHIHEMEGHTRLIEDSLARDIKELPKNPTTKSYAHGLFKVRKPDAAKARIQEALEAPGAGASYRTEAPRLSAEESARHQAVIEDQKTISSMRDEMANSGMAGYSKSKAPGTYVHRLPTGKGSALDYIRQGNKRSPITAGRFSKSHPSKNPRTLFSVTDEEGNRHVVRIATSKNKFGGKRVTLMRNGGQTKVDLGPLKSPKHDAVTEYYDAHTRSAVESVARKAGIDVSKTLSKRGNYVGRSFRGQGKIELKAGAPTRVIIHEIGHQLDEKYDLKEKFVNNPAYKKELRSLADLRFEGTDASKGFQHYVRKGEEKIAVMFEAYLHAPQRFEEIAPNTFKAFNKFLSLHDETKPLVDLKPSLVLGSEKVSDEDIPGTFRGSDGKAYRVGDATTSEITKATGQKYYIDPEMATKLDLAETGKAYTNFKAFEAIKSVLEDSGLAVKEGTVPPKHFETTQNPYFRGYSLDPQIAEVLDDASFSKDKGFGILINPLGRLLRNLIVWAPIKHDINMLATYAVDRGVTGVARPVPAVHALWDAMREMKNNGELWQSYVKSGTSSLSVGGRDLEKVVAKRLADLQGDESTIKQLAKQLGANFNPVEIYKDVQHVTVFEVQDWLNFARVIEKSRPSYFGLKKGLPFEQAVRSTERTSLQYRTPSRVGPTKAGRAVSGILNSDAVFFGRYRYDLWRLLANTMKDSINFKDPGKIPEGLNRMAATALAAAVIWPQVNKEIQKVSGVANAYIKAPGVLDIPEETQKILEGKTNLQTGASNQLYLNSAYTSLLDLKDNRDPFSGNLITDPNGSGAAQLTQALKWSVGQTAPVQNYNNLSKAEQGSRALNLLLALSSTRFPKSSALENKLNSLKFDSLSQFTQPQAKALAAKGDTKGAIKVIQDYDNKVLDTYTKTLKDAGFTPPPRAEMIKQLTASQYYYDPTLKTIQGWANPKPKPDTLQAIMNAKAAPKKGDPDYNAYRATINAKSKATKIDKANNPRLYLPAIK